MADLTPEDAFAAALARYSRPDVPKRGTGSLPHGYVHGRCGDHCNNVECPLRETHEHCTADCLRARGPALLEIPVWRGLLLGRRLLGGVVSDHG